MQLERVSSTSYFLVFSLKLKQILWNCRHRAWLADRAKPKKDFREIYEKLYPSTRHFQRNLSRDGMKRLKCLAKPRTRTFTCNPRPETVKNRKKLESSERICKLSEPRIRVDFRGDLRSISCALKVSKSAMNYEGTSCNCFMIFMNECFNFTATERITNLAAPRHKNWFPSKMKKLKKRKPKTCPCCHQTTNSKESCYFSEKRQSKTA